MALWKSGTVGMRYLILSDIHANLTALEAALEAARGRWDGVACLGDLVGYGPWPNEVIERVRSLGVLRGFSRTDVESVRRRQDAIRRARGESACGTA